MVFRVNEMYKSVQGEGPRTGEPTLFVRFAGCNFRCPGWPCDTPYAVDPKLWKNDHTKYSIDQLLDKIIEFSPIGNVCFTGGEPFLQKDLGKLINATWAIGKDVEVFTNGSFPMNRRFLENVRIMMDWKLTGSGEGGSEMEQRLANVQDLNYNDGIKFVIATDDDLGEAHTVFQNICSITGAHFWVGAAWGKYDNQKIIDYIFKHNLPWRLNYQVHKVIWTPTQRGI